MKKQLPLGYISASQAHPILSPWVTKRAWLARVSERHIVPAIKIGGIWAVSTDEVMRLKHFYEHHSDLQHTFKKLEEKGAKISFRALCARVEHGKLPTIMQDHKHWLTLPVLNELIRTECLPKQYTSSTGAVPDGFLSLNDMFVFLQKHVPWLRHEQVSSWIEHDVIISTKNKGRRLIPECEVEKILFFLNTHIDLHRASKTLKENGISISANALHTRIRQGRLKSISINNQDWIDLQDFGALFAKEKYRLAKKEAEK